MQMVEPFLQLLATVGKSHFQQLPQKLDPGVSSLQFGGWGVLLQLEMQLLQPGTILLESIQHTLVEIALEFIQRLLLIRQAALHPALQLPTAKECQHLAVMLQHLANAGLHGLLPSRKDGRDFGPIRCQ